MISPEALENGRASDGSRENIVMGDEPGQANYARIKSVACSLLNKDRQP